MPGNFFTRVIVPDSIQTMNMSKRSPLRASDLRPKTKQRTAAELLASRNTDSSWPEISCDAGISERTARRWVSTEMTPTAQYKRYGRPGKLTSGDIEKVHPGHRPIVRLIISQMTVM
jgi:hypothetical protein